MNRNDVLKIMQDAFENQEQADLRGADLYGANLRDANLYDANLRGANLRDANLCGANLCGADLYDADLYDANLRDANLCGANLRGANLRDANLRGANLRDADLYGANLYGAEGRFSVFCGGRHSAWAIKGSIGIGCQIHSRDWWLENGEGLGQGYKYTEAEILRYKNWILSLGWLEEE